MIKDRSLSSKVFDVVIHIVMVIVLLMTMYPVLYVLASSLSSVGANDRGAVSIFPVEFTLEAYKMIFMGGQVPGAFKNSVVYTVVGTVINLFFTGTYAYALSRKKLQFRGFYTLIALIPMWFSGGLIPSFILVSRSLKLYNTMWALILPGCISITNMIILRTFFQNIPEELEESAYLDGANDIVIFYKIVLPLSKAAIYTIGLYYAVAHWNGWFSAMIYLKDSNKMPLQIILRNVVLLSRNLEELARQGDRSDSLGFTNILAVKYATLIVSIIPMLVIYPFIQKHFVKGVMIGSLKG